MNDFGDHRSARPALVGAIASLVLGLASLLLRALTGVPALLLGLASLRRLNAAAPLRHAWCRGFAATGMLLGGVGTLLGILGFLSMIFLRSNETSRRVACTDNLRALGVAVEMYSEANHDRYPTAVANVPEAAALPPEKRLSWMVEMLPYLEGPVERRPGGRSPRDRRVEELDQLYARFNPSRAWDVAPNAGASATNVQRFVCLSHPRNSDYDRNGLNYYPGIAGLGADAALIPLDDPRAGILGYYRQAQVDREKKEDPLVAGRSHILLCAETMLNNGPWAAGGPSTLRSIDPDEERYIGYGRPFGGLHPGGANLLMLDGQVRFFTDAGSPRVFRNLATIRGAEP